MRFVFYDTPFSLPPFLLFLPLLIFPFVFPPSLVLEVVEKKAFGNTFDRVKRNADNLFRDGKVVGGEGGGVDKKKRIKQASKRASRLDGEMVVICGEATSYGRSIYCRCGDYVLPVKTRPRPIIH